MEIISITHEYTISTLATTILIFVMGILAIIGFLVTRNGGYGPYNTSVFLILVTVFLATILFASGLIDEKNQIIFSLYSAVIGFAAGLFNGDKKNNSSDTKKYYEVVQDTKSYFYGSLKECETFISQQDRNIRDELIIRVYKITKEVKNETI